jgi:hypothetical protein
MSRVRLIETTLLILAGILLAAATVNDVVRQSHINQRMNADMLTWRTRTGHYYHNVTVERMVFGETNQTDVVCGNTSPGAPKTRTQLCLIVTGATTEGRREVRGGWYLPANAEQDLPAERYGCFGPLGAGRCPG